MTNVKRLLHRLRASWLKASLWQQIAVVSSGLLCIFLLFFLFWKPLNDEFVELLPPGAVSEQNLSDVKVMLETKNIPYKIAENKSVWIPKNKESLFHMELAAYNMPKSKASKGYDLFDSSTWIKGEKELQILELRALKGQLEEDLAQFDNVRSASVILDMPPPRPFGNNTYQAKASVILTLRPGTRLNPQQIRAITYHIAGAVRGLAPNMIAISDTTGRLYQAIDPEGDLDSIRTAEMTAEDHIKAKIDGLLSTIVGMENFYSTVQVVMNRDKIIEERKIYSGHVDGTNLGSSVVTSILEGGQQEVKGSESALKPNQPNVEESRSQQLKQMAVPMDHKKITSNPGKIESISIGVLIDQNKVLNEGEGGSSQGGAFLQTASALRRDIENQLAVILKGYNVRTNYSVDFVNFEKRPLPIRQNYDPFVSLQESAPPSFNYEIPILIGLAITGALFLYLLFMMVFSKQPGGLLYSPEADAFEAKEAGMGIIEMERLLDNIRYRINQNPEEAAAVFRKWFAKDLYNKVDE